MAQNPLAATVAVNPSNVQTPLHATAGGRLQAVVASTAGGADALIVQDAQGVVRTAGGGVSSSLNISAATVVKATPGRLIRINVVTAGSTAGTASDVATTGGVAAANLIANIPNTVGTLTLEWPCLVGITITPGTGQVVSVSYS